jgi:WhiB family transcriptional regulator, redox-sensing transcriptional regulator
VHETLEWKTRAACGGTPNDAVFFPPRHPKSKSRQAKKICRDCPVQLECLQFALRTDSRCGVFGGLSEAERHKLHRDNAAKRQGTAVNKADCA